MISEPARFLTALLDFRLVVLIRDSQLVLSLFLAKGLDFLLEAFDLRLQDQHFLLCFGRLLPFIASKFVFIEVPQRIMRVKAVITADPSSCPFSMTCK